MKGCFRSCLGVNLLLGSRCRHHLRRLKNAIASSYSRPSWLCWHCFTASSKFLNSLKKWQNSLGLRPVAYLYSSGEFSLHPGLLEPFTLLKNFKLYIPTLTMWSSGRQCSCTMNFIRSYSQGPQHTELPKQRIAMTYPAPHISTASDNRRPNMTSGVLHPVGYMMSPTFSWLTGRARPKSISFTL